METFQKVEKETFYFVRRPHNLPEDKSKSSIYLVLMCKSTIYLVLMCKYTIYLVLMCGLPQALNLVETQSSCFTTFSMVD